MSAKPLILAIEPDRRQASQLTALVRGRLQAELVLGDCADRALAALGDRVPDLVLTAALLSPRDEAALGQRLRQLNGVAAHVQTLTIPVLAHGKSRTNALRGGSILSALRREKTDAASPDGCDPAVFAEQCKEYLSRAENERTLHTERVVLEPSRELTIEPEALAVRAPAESPAAGEWSPPTETPAPSFETSAPILEERVVAPQADSHEPAPERAIEPPRRPRGLLPAPSPEFVAWTENAALTLSRHVEPIVPVKPVDDLSDGPASLVAALAYLEAEEQESADVAPPVEPTKVEEPESEESPIEEPIDEAADLDLSTMLDDAASQGRRRDHVESEPVVEVYEIDEAFLEANEFEVAADDHASSATDEEVQSASPVSAEGAQHPKEWLDIIEALRRDAESMPVRKPAVDAAPAPRQPEPTSALRAASGNASKPADTSDVGKPSKRKRRRHGDGPAQDEWGFFDPDQCGFAALLDKLDEITDDPKS